MSVRVATRGARTGVVVFVVVVTTLRQPHDFCSDGVAFFKGITEAITDMGGTADAGEEWGLKEAGDAEGGGDEDDAEGGVGADKEVL